MRADLSERPDFDSTPASRWAPLLFDVAIMLVAGHLLIALLDVYFPYGVAVGWFGETEAGLIERLPVIRPGDPAWWAGVAGWGFALVLLRTGTQLLGWHRLTFFPLAALIPVGLHMAATGGWL